MASQRKLVQTYLIYFFTLIVSISAKEYVPALIWESSKTVNVETGAPALTKWTSDDFSDYLAKKISSYKEKPLIVVFSEENLSVEDFSWHNVVDHVSFPHLETLTKQSSRVDFLPSVHSPLRSLHDLGNHGYTFKTVQLGNESQDVSPTNDDSVLVIKMADAKTNEDRSQLLVRHDEEISQVYNQLLKTHSNILAVYTGHYSSFFDTEAEPLHRARRLLAETTTTAPETNTRLWKDSDANIFIYFFDAFPQLVKKEQGKNDTIIDLSKYSETPKSDLRGDLQRLIVSFIVDTKKITLRFRFPLSPSAYWVLREIELEDSSEKDPVILVTSSNIEAPANFSYHCGQNMVFRNNTISLTLKNVQLQPFRNTASTRFSDSYDCAWFFTIPIWTGIFITLILAMILTWGITMIMDIKTMDRFDDPKGKTIAVSATD